MGVYTEVPRHHYPIGVYTEVPRHHYPIGVYTEVPRHHYPIGVYTEVPGYLSTGTISHSEEWNLKKKSYARRLRLL